MNPDLDMDNGSYAKKERLSNCAYFGFGRPRILDKVCGGKVRIV